MGLSRDLELQVSELQDWEVVDGATTVVSAPALQTQGSVQAELDEKKPALTIQLQKGKATQDEAVSAIVATLESVAAPHSPGREDEDAIEMLAKQYSHSSLTKFLIWMKLNQDRYGLVIDSLFERENQLKHERGSISPIEKIKIEQPASERKSYQVPVTLDELNKFIRTEIFLLQEAIESHVIKLRYYNLMFMRGEVLEIDEHIDVTQSARKMFAAVNAAIHQIEAAIRDHQFHHVDKPHYGNRLYNFLQEKEAINLLQEAVYKVCRDYEILLNNAKRPFNEMPVINEADALKIQSDYLELIKRETLIKLLSHAPASQAPSLLESTSELVDIDSESEREREDDIANDASADARDDLESTGVADDAADEVASDASNNVGELENANNEIQAILQSGRVSAEGMFRVSLGGSKTPDGIPAADKLKYGRLTP